MTHGELTRIAYQSRTKEFPEGCAVTAWRNIIKKIGDVNSSNKRIMKAEFESEREKTQLNTLMN